MSDEASAMVVGYVEGIVQWDKYLTHLVPVEVGGIVAVLANTCGQSYTFELNGTDVSKCMT